MNTPESEKGGSDPSDVTLDEISKNLFSFLCLNESEEQIKKKYGIKQNFWPEDDIKRVWEEIQRKGINSDERKHWPVVILLQILKRSFVCGECKLQAAQENRHAITDEQGCKTTPSLKVNPEDRPSQSNAKLDTLRAAGGVERLPERKRTTSSQNYSVQPCAAGGETSKRKPTEESGAASESPLSASSADVASTTAELSKLSVDENIRIYIRIPLKVMLLNEEKQEIEERQDQPDKPTYKLIDGSPSALNAVLRKRKSYAMSFNNRTNNAVWVYEILNRDTLRENYVNQSNFRPYHKGHLAPVRNHRWCQEAHDNVNFFSNIVPQNQTLNTGPWSSAENECRRLTRENGVRNVHVYSGPLYKRPMDPQWIQEKCVPSHFFKVIIVENYDGTVREPGCYVFPNGNLGQDHLGDLTEHRTTIEYLQRVSGLTFIERRPNVTERNQRIVTTLTGQEGNRGNREQRNIQTATIQVRLVCIS